MRIEYDPQTVSYAQLLSVLSSKIAIDLEAKGGSQAAYPKPQYRCVCEGGSKQFYIWSRWKALLVSILSCLLKKMSSGKWVRRQLCEHLKSLSHCLHSLCRPILMYGSEAEQQDATHMVRVC